MWWEWAVAGVKSGQPGPELELEPAMPSPELAAYTKPHIHLSRPVPCVHKRTREGWGTRAEVGLGCVSEGSSSA